MRSQALQRGTKFITDDVTQVDFKRILLELIHHVCTNYSTTNRGSL